MAATFRQQAATADRRLRQLTIIILTRYDRIHCLAFDLRLIDGKSGSSSSQLVLMPMDSCFAFKTTKSYARLQQQQQEKQTRAMIHTLAADSSSGSILLFLPNPC